MPRCHPIRGVARRALPLALAALVGLPAAAYAQTRGYLIGAPRGSIGLRGGLALATANSDLYDDVIDQFTLSRSDFLGFSGAMDLSFAVAPRFDLVVTGAVAQSSANSEYREFIGDDDLPIAQRTKLTRVPVTASVKAYLTPRGRQIGTLAWIPQRVAPWVGAGGGAMWYRFEQTGEFVYEPTLDIFQDELLSDGWSATWHAFGGVDVSLGPRFALVGEARYVLASADLDQDFQGYEPIDLSGLQTTVGFKVRF